MCSVQVVETVHFIMGGDLWGLGGRPPNLRWGTVHASVPPIFGEVVTVVLLEMWESTNKRKLKLKSFVK